MFSSSYNFDLCLKMLIISNSTPGGGVGPLTFAGEGIVPTFDASYVNNTITRVGPCGKPNPFAFNIVRPADDDAFPWPGILIGALIFSVWHWCSDQVRKSNIMQD